MSWQDKLFMDPEDVEEWLTRVRNESAAQREALNKRLREDPDMCQDFARQFYAGMRRVDNNGIVVWVKE